MEQLGHHVAMPNAVDPCNHFVENLVGQVQLLFAGQAVVVYHKGHCHTGLIHCTNRFVAALGNYSAGQVRREDLVVHHGSKHMCALPRGCGADHCVEAPKTEADSLGTNTKLWSRVDDKRELLGGSVLEEAGPVAQRAIYQQPGTHLHTCSVSMAMEPSTRNSPWLSSMNAR